MIDTKAIDYLFRRYDLLLDEAKQKVRSMRHERDANVRREINRHLAKLDSDAEKVREQIYVALDALWKSD